MCLIAPDSLDCNLLGSSVHGIFQARILEWVAISFSKKHKLMWRLNRTTLKKTFNIILEI